MATREKVSWAVVYAVVLAITAAMTAVPANAHYYEVSSVKADANGGHMNMRDFTAYNSSFQEVIRDWDPLNCYWGGTCEGVNVAEVASLSASQVDFYDANDCTTGVVGQHQTNYDPDKIIFNACNMNKLTTEDRLWVGTHEGGHGLLLGHTPQLEEWKTKSVMYPTNAGVNNMQTHDYGDYHDKWISGNLGDTTP